MSIPIRITDPSISERPLGQSIQEDASTPSTRSSTGTLIDKKKDYYPINYPLATTLCLFGVLPGVIYLIAINILKHNHPIEQLHRSLVENKTLTFAVGSAEEPIQTTECSPLIAAHIEGKGSPKQLVYGTNNSCPVLRQAKELIENGFTTIHAYYQKKPFSEHEHLSKYLEEKENFWKPLLEEYCANNGLHIENQDDLDSTLRQIKTNIFTTIFTPLAENSQWDPLSIHSFSTANGAQFLEQCHENYCNHRLLKTNPHIDFIQLFKETLSEYCDKHSVGHTLAHFLIFLHEKWAQEEAIQLVLEDTLAKKEEEIQSKICHCVLQILGDWANIPYNEGFTNLDIKNSLSVLQVLLYEHLKAPWTEQEMKLRQENDEFVITDQLEEPTLFFLPPNGLTSYLSAEWVYTMQTTKTTQKYLLTMYISLTQDPLYEKPVLISWKRTGTVLR